MIVWAQKKEKQTFKEDKKHFPDPSQMLVIKKKTLICITEHVCACLYVPGEILTQVL